jgi:hypothetical protein
VRCRLLGGCSKHEARTEAKSVVQQEQLVRNYCRSGRAPKAGDFIRRARGHEGTRAGEECEVCRHSDSTAVCGCFGVDEEGARAHQLLRLSSERGVSSDSTPVCTVICLLKLDLTHRTSVEVVCPIAQSLRVECSEMSPWFRATARHKVEILLLQDARS